MGAVEFTLPHSFGWLTAQSEPGVQARDVVDERFDDLKNLVTSTKAEFDNAIATLSSAVPTITVNTIPNSTFSLSPFTDAIPSFTDEFDTTFTETLDEFTDTPGTFTATVDEFTESLGSFTDTLEDFSATTDITVFSDTLGEFSESITACSASYATPSGEPDYQTVTWVDPTLLLNTDLVAKLTTWLTEEKSAIPTAVFDAIYATATTALDEDRLAAISRLESEVASRGFALPSGVLDNRTISIEREYVKGAAEVSAKISERNMELTQANYHKAVEVANAHIAAALDYAIKKNTAKIQLYDSAVSAWSKKLDAAVAKYSADISKYLGDIEAYKAKVSGYLGEVEGYKAKITLYSAKTDAYKAEVSAYVAKVQAYAEKIASYANSIEGYKAENAVFLSKIQAYSAKISKYSIDMDKYKAQVSAYLAKVEAYKAAISLYDTDAKVYMSSIDAYAANIEGLKAKALATSEYVKAQVDLFQADSTVNIEEEKLSLQAKMANAELTAKIADSTANLYATMTAAGLAGLHVQASISSSHGTGQQVSYSYNYGEQLSEGHSESISVNAEV